MKIYRKKAKVNVLLVALLLIGFSCQDEDSSIPVTNSSASISDKVSIRPLTDERIKAEILAMAKAGEEFEAQEADKTQANGRASAVPPYPPILPTGYNYSNLTAVQIQGVPGTTYVAYSLTQNTPILKELMAIYYDNNGVYKNFMPTKWEATYVGSGMYGYSYTYKIFTTPQCGIGSQQIPTQTGSLKASFLGSPSATTAGVIKVRGPGACGQIVVDCIDEFYTGQGWLSVGLFLGTLVQPEIGVGVVAGCMIGCGLSLYPLQAC